MSISLNKVVPWGRSRREYELMFGLSASDLPKRILGCADGPASFNAEMMLDGYSVISIDPIYELSGDEIKQRFEKTVDGMLDQVKATPDCWTWKYHRDVDDLHRNRCRVIDLFLADYEAGRAAGRYLVGSLPRLPFGDEAFQLALCSHFLFLYSDLFSQEFHIQSALDLCRVAAEVRVFPLLTLAQTVSPHLDPVRNRLAKLGVSSTVETVEYELQRGGNQMLRLFRQ